MAIKAIIATLILGSSSLALAQPGGRVEQRTENDRAELRHDRSELRADRRIEHRSEGRHEERLEHRADHRRVERERRFERVQQLRHERGRR